MVSQINVESSILLALEEHGPCSMDQLRHRLNGYTWSQVFEIVGKLSREGHINLRHTGNFEYIASLYEPAPSSSNDHGHGHRRSKVRPGSQGTIEEKT
jgi:hypothetical protein